ncbi:glutamine synthetase [Blastomyces dermatitidis ER-3]|uniref:Glutamine synthetase n=1 Tax=Ajellomyces dermatitidis (strain ER-3 / ATCC MYA-2586) TaxID=559297 RepID=A0ABM9YIH1_AJEDR|nr:glutamine synthetase [Blastomyces dermatitidis ER-3]EEQ91666.1 glutamine synthetase [Blastomyces dermatitidis ER-3]
MSPETEVTLDNLSIILEQDTQVKLAGIDADGILRGKLVSKRKFLSIAQDGFGFCSVIFGWDMHDHTYFKELGISNKENGYRDMLAIPDLTSFRRIPWEDNVPFFLINFFDPDTKEPVSACPRGLLRTAAEKMEKLGYRAMAGAEYEFYQFRAPPNPNALERNSSSTATFLRENPVDALPPLTEGMFGYSLTRTVHNQEYFYRVFNTCHEFKCDIESWHTESGPGVFEAALEFGEIKEIADRAGLFKYVVKCLGSKYGITPVFMAKPRQGLPGNSGHMHVSLVSDTGINLFSRDEPDPSPPYSDVAYLSDMGRHFLAGVLDGLPDIMPLFAPTINSYKRLVENFWAPVTVSWGLEHRAASIRVITPPTSSPKGTRLEVRVPGADANPHYVLAAILALGWRGVEKKLALPVPPLPRGAEVGSSTDQGARLAKSLKEAVAVFTRKESVAREVFGDAFVDHFGGTREHEIRLWEEAVTDWEVKRYIETV